MNLRWIKLSAVALPLLGGAAWLEHHSIQHLRLEQQALLAQQAEVEELTRTLQAGAAPAAASDERATLRATTRELPKLRNEVRQLRAQQAEWIRLQAENERLAAQIQATTRPRQSISEMEGFVAKESWTYAGLSTPQSAVQSFFWAMREKDLEKMAGCLSPPEGSRLLKQFQEDFDLLSRMKGFRIASQAAESTDRMVLSVEVAAGGEPMKLTVRRYGAEWRIESW